MPESTKQAITIAVSCLSGGSGKTTTSLNLAIMLSSKGKTLAVDFDPQGNLSQWMGWRDLSSEATIAETIVPGEDSLDIKEIIKKPKNEERDSLEIAPADYSLSGAGEVIAPRPGRERFLKRALKSVVDDYDYVVIDTPPAKGILTYNGLLAADLVVIPTECTNKGVMGAINTITLIKELEEIDFVVPKILGVIPTRDQWSGANQTRMSKAAIATLSEVLEEVHIFSSVRHSTVVQQANNAGWSLAEMGKESLSNAYTEVVNAVRNI